MKTYAAGDTVTLQGDRREVAMKPREWAIMSATSCGRGYVVRRTDDDRIARWMPRSGLITGWAGSKMVRLAVNVVVV